MAAGPLARNGRIMNTTSRQPRCAPPVGEFLRRATRSCGAEAPSIGPDLPDLLVRPAAVDRVRRHLAEAELLFVARVVQDGGIGSWRLHARERFVTARRAVAHGRISSVATADLVVALVDQHVRDWCWLEVESAPDPGWAALWLHLVRHALSPFRAEPLFLLGWTAWRRDDGALARAATAAARAEDPGHEAARLLEKLLDSGAEPADLPSLADWQARPDVAGWEDR
jgi:hypothetical protein